MRKGLLFVIFVVALLAGCVQTATFCIEQHIDTDCGPTTIRAEYEVK